MLEILQKIERLQASLHQVEQRQDSANSHVFFVDSLEEGWCESVRTLSKNFPVVTVEYGGLPK